LESWKFSCRGRPPERDTPYQGLLGCIPIFSPLLVGPVFLVVQCRLELLCFSGCATLQFSHGSDGLWSTKTSRTVNFKRTFTNSYRTRKTRRKRNQNTWKKMKKK
jgi:hypothetical protein